MAKKASCISIVVKSYSDLEPPQKLRARRSVLPVYGRYGAIDGIIPPTMWDKFRGYIYGGKIRKARAFARQQENAWLEVHRSTAL